MKKAIGEFFLTAFLIVLLPLCVMFAIFKLPFDYLKYKRSPYYKKERKKYSLFAATGSNFEIYNEILKNDLPIRFIENPRDPSVECGRFVFGDMVIIPDEYSFEFDCESGTWQYCCETDEEKSDLLSLDEYIQDEINTANELAGQEICNDAIVLIDGDCVDDLEKAKAEKRFLVYENNRAEVLKRFCENPMQWRNKEGRL